jgi:hypothetical protein
MRTLGVKRYAALIHEDPEGGLFQKRTKAAGEPGAIRVSRQTLKWTERYEQ